MKVQLGRSALAEHRPGRATRRGFLVSALTVGVLAGFASGEATAQELKDVTIGLPGTAIVSSSLRIAEEMGLFKKYGLRAQFNRLDSGNLSAAALVSGSLNFAVAGPTDFIAARLAGQAIVTPASLFKGYANFVVLSKPVVARLGVSSNAPAAVRLKALEGLLMAGTSATAVSRLAVKATADAAGVSMRYTYLAQDNMPTALESGAIDGYIASTPAWAVPVVRGTAELWLSGITDDFPAETTPGVSSILMVREDFATKNSDLVDKVVSVLSDFAKLIKDDPASVKAAVRKLYPDLDPRIIEIFFMKEVDGWGGWALTTEDMRREINFLRVTGALSAQKLAELDPAAMIYKKPGATKN
jgi:ABC-type nitrate/sulfonate/bicarbonate transport system substrate-binding protein